MEAYAAISYDAAGNVVNDGQHSYEYDAENRVVSVDGGATASYGYDHQNRRVKKVVGGVTRHYVWEGSQVIAEHNGATGSQLVRYIYAGSRLIAKVEGANTRYYISDRLSARLVLDTSGNVVGKQSHLPFGEEIGGTGEQQKQRFTSYESDSETGTDYAVNRQYAQGVGRFMRVDPYKGSSEQLFPQTWNRYSYTLNDPVNATDPLGTVPTDPLAPGFSSGKRYPGWMLCWILPWFCEPAIPGEARREGQQKERIGPPIVVTKNCPSQDFSFKESIGNLSPSNLAEVLQVAVGEASYRGFNEDEVGAIIATMFLRRVYNMRAELEDRQHPFSGGTTIIGIISSGEYDAYDSRSGETKLLQEKGLNRGRLPVDSYVCDQIIAARKFIKQFATADFPHDIFELYPFTSFVGLGGEAPRNAVQYGDTRFWLNSGLVPL